MPGNSYSLGLAQTLLWKVRNFSRNAYSFNPGDNLEKLTGILLGQSGTGFLSLLQTVARLSQQYLQFSDLENILGQLLRAPRLVSETYSINLNPFTDQLSNDQWREVLAKDSLYRERLVAISSAKLRGATNLGLQSMAESSSVAKFNVYESWTSASGVLTASGYSKGLGHTEIVLVPNVPSDLQFTQEMYLNTLLLTDSIRPVGMSITVSSGTINTFLPVTYSSISGNSSFTTLERTVVANNINIPTSVLTTNNQGLNSRYWLNNGQATVAPYFAFSQTQEQEIDVTGNIVNVEVVQSQGSITSTTSLLGLPSLPVTSTLFGER